MAERLLSEGFEGPRHRMIAIALMIGAVVSFSLLDSTAKYLVTEGLPVAEVVWVRFTAHAIFTSLVLWPIATVSPFKTKKPFHQILRSLFMFGATALNFFALRYLQLDQTVTIFFLGPLIVAGLAGPILGEWVGWRRLAAIMVGFIGVLIVIRPGLGGIHWAASLTLISTFCLSLYSIWTRYLAHYDPAEVTQFYSPLAGVVLAMPFALLAWEMPPDGFTWLLLATLGLWGGGGHWLLILAHRRAQAPVLAPFIYVGLLSNTIIGYAVFGDIPTWWTLAGGAVVILSGLYLIWRERSAGKNEGEAAADIAPQ
ncbi:DMT family transporter [Methyloligella solikamskensis]|uniref:DMT family transporter n=1 Tax=Methyloligella solikamskensis TaxID=1177756 RepID=A0ABW3JB18_9HYPH